MTKHLKIKDQKIVLFIIQNKIFIKKVEVILKIVLIIINKFK